MFSARSAAFIRLSLAVFTLAILDSRPMRAIDPALDPQVQAKLGTVYAHRAEISILGQTAAMATLKSEDLSAVVEQADGYLPAMAILEARHRMDSSVHAKVRERYKKIILDPGEVQFDPHFISQASATLLASTEYLAATDKDRFLPELLDRAEVWAVPLWFRATFAAVGPGWVKAVIDRAKSLGPDWGAAILMGLVAGGASEANLPELQSALQTEQSDAWMAAMEACVRVSNGGCWDLINQEAFRQTPREQLRVSLLALQNHRIEATAAFLTAERAANAITQTQSRLEKAQLAIELGGFIRIMRASGSPPPPTLVEAIRTSRIAPLLKEAIGN